MSVDKPTSTTAREASIAIVGIGCRFAGASDVHEFWSNILSGKDALAPAVEHQHAPGAPRRGALSSISHFDSDFFGISGDEALQIDPQHRLLLEVVWEAFEDAGHVPGRIPGRVAVYASCGNPSYLSLLQANGVAHAAAFLGNAPDTISARISYKLGFTGESLTVHAACASGLVGLHLAAQSLLSGTCDMAVVGAAAVRGDFGTSYFDGIGAGVLSPDGCCRPFDAEANGTVEGDGVAAIILRRGDDAIADRDNIYAFVRASSINNDGSRKAGFAAPGVAGATAVIADVLSKTALSPSAVGYIETHGTGTAIGDAIEIEAMNRTYGADAAGRYGIGSVKPNIGHCGHAAGLAGLIKAALVLRAATVPPTLNFQTPNPACYLDRRPFTVVNAPTRMSGELRHAAVSAFGVGGTNAHVALDAWVPPRHSAGDNRDSVPIVLSARTETALLEQRRRLARFLARAPEVSLHDVAFTLGVGRATHASRWEARVTSMEELIAALEASAAQGPVVPPPGPDPSQDVPPPAASFPDARRVSLPTYPFERRRYWPGDAAASTD